MAARDPEKWEGTDHKRAQENFMGWWKYSTYASYTTCQNSKNCTSIKE